MKKAIMILAFLGLPFVAIAGEISFDDLIKTEARLEILQRQYEQKYNEITINLAVVKAKIAKAKMEKKDDEKPVENPANTGR
jgi:hypothetical protein